MAARRGALDRAAERARAEAEALAAAQAAAAAAATLARPFADALGRAHPPVEGRMLGGWGDADGNGRIRRGISLAAKPFATVVAPWHGTIAYAGPFRGYGAILIVESSDGYHWFIAGLDRLDVAHGQAVLAGEPVGRVGAAGRPDPTIYVELRRNGQPIDPGPWLAAPNGRMSG
jgi:septal ring factor EnvC (AmiA/AmiB activator)